MTRCSWCEKPATVYVQVHPELWHARCDAHAAETPQYPTAPIAAEVPEGVAVVQPVAR